MSEAKMEIKVTSPKPFLQNAIQQCARKIARSMAEHLTTVILLSRHIKKAADFEGVPLTQDQADSIAKHVAVHFKIRKKNK